MLDYEVMYGRIDAISRGTNLKSISTRVLENDPCILRLDFLQIL